MKLLSILILIGISQLSYAQNKLYIGSSIGYAPGKTSMDFRVFDKPIYGMNTEHNFLVGADLFYQLYRSPIGFSTGLMYNRKWDYNENAYSYFTQPLIFNATIGSKYFFQAGIGAYYSVLLKHALNDFENKTYGFLYGRIISFGFGMSIKENIIKLKFENYADITTATQRGVGRYIYFYKFQVNCITLDYLFKIN